MNHENENTLCLHLYYIAFLECFMLNTKRRSKETCGNPYIQSFIHNSLTDNILYFGG